MQRRQSGRKNIVEMNSSVIPALIVLLVYLGEFGFFNICYINFTAIFLNNTYM